jgi:hypothetical protein
MTTTLNTSRSENTMVLSARVSACMYFLVYTNTLIVNQWVTQDKKGSIDNSRRTGRGSTMHPTINEESDFLTMAPALCKFS